MPKKKVIIIGAGPGGLTAAYEFLHRTDILPVIFESGSQVGGISKTVNYKGNRIDIGGHRFFSKSDRVVSWWINILPLQGKPSKDDLILNRPVNLSKDPLAPDPQKVDQVLLIRQRISRIFTFRKFFSYPVSLSFETIQNLGIVRMVKILFSYFQARLFPIRHERHLEDFFINRFGNELYQTFFKSYTEKVWGITCTEISPEWGAQRIKGLSITKAAWHAFKKIFSFDATLSQKTTETSLIERFMYPKFGPGLMWETVEKIVRNKGAEVHLQHDVVTIKCEGQRINGVEVKNKLTGQVSYVQGDYVLSTMPIKDLICFMQPTAPSSVMDIAKSLEYRDFITVGLLVKRLKIKNKTKIKTINDIVPDNWIYIQEPDVKIARLQIFNNWSPYMIADPDHVWMGLEYMCQEGDELWQKSENDFINFAVDELVKIGIIDREDVLDHTLIKVPKAYPSYTGSYKSFDTIRHFTDTFENLFLVGRNGMHRYNNQDHSMLTAMTVVDNILIHQTSKDNIWSVNTEQEFHEEKKST